MKSYARVFLLVSFLITTISVSGQVVQNMTSERVREAIALGTSTKEVRPYKIQEKARWSWPPLIGYYTTPFIRVALAANAAKRRYQSFTEANVTPEMTVPAIEVYAPSHSVGGAEIANVVTVVLLPHGSKDTSRAIQPEKMEDVTEQYKNLFGFTGEGGGKVAFFPLDAWSENYDVHVVFDREIPSSQGSGSRGGCTDCKARIYLDKIQ